MIPTNKTLEKIGNQIKDSITSLHYDTKRKAAYNRRRIIGICKTCKSAICTCQLSLHDWINIGNKKNWRGMDFEKPKYKSTKCEKCNLHLCMCHLRNEDEDLILEIADAVGINKTNKEREIINKLIEEV